MSTLPGLVAALVAAVAPSATANQPVVLAARVSPPAHIRVLNIPVTPTDKRTRTCNARGSNRTAGPVERNLAPVACEQPPRSKVILTFQGGLFGSGH